MYIYICVVTLYYILIVDYNNVVMIIETIPQ